MNRLFKFFIFIPFILTATISLLLYWLGNTFGHTAWRPEDGVVSKDRPFSQFFDLVAGILFFIGVYFIFRTEIANQVVSISPLFIFKTVISAVLLLIVIGINRVANSGEWKEWPLLNKIVTKFLSLQKGINQNSDN